MAAPLEKGPEATAGRFAGAPDPIIPVASGASAIALPLRVKNSASPARSVQTLTRPSWTAL